MARNLKNIGFVVEEFTVPSPGQQLLDRFLIGYPRDGKFHRLEGCRVTAHLTPGADDRELNRRVKDFKLTLDASPQKAVSDANAVIVVWRGNGTSASEGTLQAVLQAMPAGGTCFVLGALAAGSEVARAMVRIAATRNITLLSGSPLGVTWRLPEVRLAKDAVAKEALVVVQGETPAALLDGLECLLPIVEARRGGETGVRRIRFLQGAEVWKAGEAKEWSWPLLAAALSRSDSPQGDPVKDGRTQDLVGLGLVSKLATAPRAWQIEHRDGLRTTILALDGVVADYNFAVRTANERIISAQIYRAPQPAEEHYSRLAEVLENHFRGEAAPWRTEHGMLIAGLLEGFGLSKNSGWTELK